MKPFDLGRKKGPPETALWKALQVQLSQEGVGKEIIRKHKKPKKCKKRSVQAGNSEKF